MMANANRVDPYANFSFLVELDGITRAGFHDVSGLESTINVHSYKEGGADFESKLPMRTTYSNIVLKWGLTDDLEMYTWHRQAELGSVQRKNGSVILRDRQGNEKVRWNFFAAWPTKYTGPTLNSEGNDVAIETLELAHEGLERVS